MTDAQVLSSSGLMLMQGYNAWANRLVLDRMLGISDEEYFNRPVVSHTNLHGLVKHFLTGEEYFLDVCRGEKAFKTRELKDLGAVIEFQRSLEVRQREYIAQLSAAEMEAAPEVKLLGRSYSFPRYKLLLQGFMHSTHHRGELAMVLGQMGHSPPTFDIIVWFMQQSG